MERNFLATAIVLFVDFVDARELHNVSAILVLRGSFKPTIITYYSYRTKRSHELFYNIAGFPGVVATIDCTHVRIKYILLLL